MAGAVTLPRSSGVSPSGQTHLPRWIALWAGLALTLGCGEDAPGADVNNGLSPYEWDHVANRPRGPRPSFSFFVTSQTGLFGLPAGDRFPAPDPVEGFGGNFGGLAGADEICTTLAQQANPGDTKIWQAFLSTGGEDGGVRVDAIDRIGYGPWYDFNGFLLARNLDELMPVGFDGRPSGADARLAAMFTGENGDDARSSAMVDNHDILTGSGPDGRLFEDGAGGRIATCADWTSSDLRGRPSDAFGQNGQVPVGHSWPRNNAEGRHWISEHTVNGCEPGAAIDRGTVPSRDDFTVGAGGGYGGIYCFALNALERPADGGE
jgi:hypothetical protein